MSYHFPPAQSAGALRWQKLARHAFDFGWNLDVITLDPASLDQQDMAGLEELPPGTRVYGVSPPTPALAKIEQSMLRLKNAMKPGGGGRPQAPDRNRSSVRPDSFSRDEIRWRPRSVRDVARAFFSTVDYARYGAWARAAATVGGELAEYSVYGAVVTCGPPHMVHEGGRLLARSLSVPFIMDLRDPWSLWQRLPEHHASRVWLTLARRFERRCVREASLVAVNTDSLRLAMQAAYPEASRRIVTVMNGFDEEAFVTSNPGSRFIIAYAGAVYIDRDPRPLLAAAARLIQDARLDSTQVSIEFMGEARSFQGTTIEQLSEEAGISEYVRSHPARPRKEALRFLATASVLLILPQDSELAIPSKLFEYVRYDAWILALARPESAVAHVLRGTEAMVVDPEDACGLVAALHGAYRRFAEGQRPRAVAASHPQLSRRAQATVLFDSIGECVGGGFQSRFGVVVGGP